MRSWLNGTFLNTAFTEKQQQAILSVTVKNDADSGYSGFKRGGSDDTKDKVFLLSYA